MKVHIASALRSYTGDASVVEAPGLTLGDVLAELDRRFPGIRFRVVDEQDGIRPHMKIFVNGEIAAGLRVPLRSDDEIHLLCSLSGG